MSEDTFNEWVKDYNKYATNLPGSSEGTSVSCETSAVDSEEGESAGCGLDALFDSAVEESNERISQHVVKLDNGRLFTLKTPGEIGL